MSEHTSLAMLVQSTTTYSGSWRNTQLAQDVKDFLWTTYDLYGDLIYPTLSNWDDLLAETIETNDYCVLTKDEVLSILFGLNHRNRIVEGLWWSMFERGVTQKLLAQLLEFDSE